MRLKQRPEDFIVREVELTQRIDPDGDGPYAVYELTKRKATTHEALEIIARALGVEKRDIKVAGLKDRQSLSTQLVSVPGRGREVRLPDLHLKFLGRAAAPVSSEDSAGNAFDITVRDLHPKDVEVAQRTQGAVEHIGLPNYYDDQRFGCIRFGQGFVARDLIAGRFEKALKAVIAMPLPSDDKEESHRKALIARKWGEWEDLSNILGHARHGSVMEYLSENPRDYAGAFVRLGTWFKTIHLFAFQSYIWNQAVSLYLKRLLAGANRVMLPTAIGNLVAWRKLPTDLTQRFVDNQETFPLPAPDLKVRDGRMAKALAEVLQWEGLTLATFRIPAEGLYFLPEERPLALVPQKPRFNDPMRDHLNRGRLALRMQFTLPRGSYATMVVKRLFADSRDVGQLAPPGEGRNATPPRHDRRDDRRGSRDDRPRGGHRDRDDRRGNRDDRPRGDRDRRDDRPRGGSDNRKSFRDRGRDTREDSREGGGRDGGGKRFGKPHGSGRTGGKPGKPWEKKHPRGSGRKPGGKPWEKKRSRDAGEKPRGTPPGAPSGDAGGGYAPIGQAFSSGGGKPNPGPKPHGKGWSQEKRRRPRRGRGRSIKRFEPREGDKDSSE